MEEKKYKVPNIVWLKVTDYQHAWLQRELGGGARVGDQRVVSVQHLPGARDVLKMETVEDMMEPVKVDKVMSATRRNCIKAGLTLDEKVIEREYGITQENLKLFVPIECPKMRLTENGVLRPWTNDTCLGRRQANELIVVIREAFWAGVEEFNREYARQHRGEKYAAVDMIEAFCRDTQTPDIHVDAMRHEWQRRLRSGKSKGS